MGDIEREREREYYENKPKLEAKGQVGWGTLWGAEITLTRCNKIGEASHVKKS